jgi:hypothetical protein
MFGEIAEVNIYVMLMAIVTTLHVAFGCAVRANTFDCLSETNLISDLQCNFHLMFLS